MEVLTGAAEVVDVRTHFFTSPPVFRYLATFRAIRLQNLKTQPNIKTDPEPHFCHVSELEKLSPNNIPCSQTEMALPR